MLLHENNNIFVAKTCLSTFFVRYLIEYFPFDYLYTEEGYRSGLGSNVHPYN
jgi:hypothetical protein